MAVAYPDLFLDNPLQKKQLYHSLARWDHSGKARWHGHCPLSLSSRRADNGARELGTKNLGANATALAAHRFKRARPRNGSVVLGAGSSARRARPFFMRKQEHARGSGRAGPLCWKAPLSASENVLDRRKSEREIRRGCERNQCDAPSARRFILPDMARVEMSDFAWINSTTAQRELDSSARSRHATGEAEQSAYRSMC